MEEEWKDIPGYEGIYQASSYGRIRTKPGKTTYTKRHGVRHWKTRVLKHKGNADVGFRVSLYKDGKPNDWLVHRLIAMAFHGVPDEYMTVNHINGDRNNNTPENLEWLSLEDNIKHGFRTGLYAKNQHNITLISVDGESVDFDSQSEASRFLGRCHGYIWGCIKYDSIPISKDGKKYEIAS